MKKLIYIAASLAMVFSSCSKDDDSKWFEVNTSEGETLTLQGGEGGKDAANTVYVDLSEEAQLSVSGVRGSTLFDDKPILIQIDVLKGTNAYFTTNIQESEIILKRNQSLVIKRVVKDGEKIVMYCEAWVKP